ncbi:MAG: nucleotidyltransferase domain-containing protein [Thermoprotei archaeon]|nr:nucleotidyltransferase domain-containing protein [Thermoprotei archaeon]
MTSLSFKALTRWAEHVKSIWEAIKRAAPESQVYLTGGAAEGRLTALSDIDIVIALKHEPSYEEAVNLRVRIMEELDRAGVPSHIPLDIHIVGGSKTLKGIRP